MKYFLKTPKIGIESGKIYTTNTKTDPRLGPRNLQDKLRLPKIETKTLKKKKQNRKELTRIQHVK